MYTRRTNDLHAVFHATHRDATLSLHISKPHAVRGILALVHGRERARHGRSGAHANDRRLCRGVSLGYMRTTEQNTDQDRGECRPQERFLTPSAHSHPQHQVLRPRQDLRPGLTQRSGATDILI